MANGTQPPGPADRPDPRSAGGINAAAHAIAIQRINTNYLLSAREAAQDSVLFAATAFGISEDFATWPVSAPIEEVMVLALLPICVLSLRLPERALRQCTARTSGPPARRQAALSLVTLHTALVALDDA